jgi:hypothetical protein
MNPNQTFEQVDLNINDNDESWKDTRLTCEYDPLADVADPLFDFDSLQEPDELPKMTRCRCDDSEPEYAFSRVPVRSGTFQCDFVHCDECNYMMLDQDKIMNNGDILCSCCYNDIKLLEKYTEEQCEQLIKYAEKHSLTIEESIDYQTHCHCCGKEVEDGFDESNHQYCKEKCFEHCEDYWYHCYRGEECKVCDIWEYHARRDSLTAHDIELSDCEPVLNAIDCFKELGVYGQLYECLGDLVEYFDSDRQWRYDFV